MQLTKELQCFTEAHRFLIKVLTKEMKKPDKRLQVCQECWSFMQTQIDISSSSSFDFSDGPLISLIRLFAVFGS